MKMDPQLEKAAEEGDVEFLKQALAVQNSQYFLTQTDYYGKSILHLAVKRSKVEFIKILPTHILKPLLHITDLYACTPFHAAAKSGNISTINCIREMYASFSWDDDEDHVNPWVALNSHKETPLNYALRNGEADEKSVMEIMMMDPEHLSWTIASEYGNTPLYYAIKKEYKLVADKISMSPLGPTSFVSHPRFDDLFTDHSGYLVEYLQKWGYIDIDGNTPLHSALNSKSTEEALQILSYQPNLSRIVNDKGESAFFLAVRFGCEQVVYEIITGYHKPRFHMLRRNDGTTVLHCLSSCTEETGRMLLGKYWWLMNARDDQGKTALDYAKQEETEWLVNLLTNTSLIQKQDFDWMEAFERKDIEAIHAFLDTCEDVAEACREKNGTPLHRLELPTYEDYLNILKIRSVAKIKNTTNYLGETPLHCALQRKDMHFARALLCDKDVNRTIRDRRGVTSMDLLAKLCTENNEWVCGAYVLGT